MRPGWPHWVAWAELAIYVTGWVITARIMCRDVDGQGDVGPLDRLAAAFLAFFWPAAAAVAVPAAVLLLPTLGCRAGTQRLRRKRQAAGARKREHEKFEARTAELERDLGIGQDE